MVKALRESLEDLDRGRVVTNAKAKKRLALASLLRQRLLG